MINTLSIVMVNEAVTWLPAVSVAMNVTVVTPIENASLELLLDVRVAIPEFSIAVGWISRSQRPLKNCCLYLVQHKMVSVWYVWYECVFLVCTRMCTHIKICMLYMKWPILTGDLLRFKLSKKSNVYNRGVSDW